MVDASAPPAAVSKSEEPKEERDTSPEAVAVAACIAESKLSHCVPLFEGNVDPLETEAGRRGSACTRGCIGERDERLKRVVAEAADSCRESYVRSAGRKAPRCEFPKRPKTRDPRELSMRFQDALRAAIEKPAETSARALEDTLKFLDAEYLAGVEPECTKKCRADGAAALAR